MSLYDFTASRLDGTDSSLRDYEGRVLLIVNTASKCGFTPQYEGLEALYRDYAPRGFSVLGFPCNQFGEQEPGKSDVNGEAAHPLYQWLKKEAPGVLGSERIKWNFTKFLIDRDGRVVGRFAPTTKPEELKSHIERLL